MRHRNRDRGASLVEFAIVVPLLATFLLGIVQFGLAYDKNQSVNSAAREGARHAALPTSDLSSIEEATRRAFVGLDDDDQVSVVVEHSVDGVVTDATAKPCETAGNVTVAATVEHVLTIPFFGAPVIDIDGSGEFRCETF